MMTRFPLLCLFAGWLMSESFVVGKPIDESKSKQRDFDFTYAVRISELPLTKTTRIWIPVPSSSFEQDVKILHRDVPKQARLTRDSLYRNRMLYVETKPNAQGVIEMSMTYRIRRRELRQPIQETLSADHFLKANVLVPIDGKPLKLLTGRTLSGDSRKRARVLYDLVLSHVDYDKSVKGWGRGDVHWVCDSRKGNCSDFHSLFISLARSQKIPAKFEIGFSLPTKRGEGTIAGYHCWSKFYDKSKGWTAIDASEADKHPEMKEYYFGNLTENRVSFSQGRDLKLAPAQRGKPINFFIYPHFEVDGKSYPFDKVRTKFSFKDLE